MVIRVPLGRYSQIQSTCVLDEFPVPMENEDETKTHLQAGSQAERGMTGASFATVIPSQGTPHHIWDGVGCDRPKTSHKLSDVPSPTGRARIVTNRVVRSTKVAAAEVP